MSMSTYVVGIRPPDATWLQMKGIYDMCVAAHVPVPAEVVQFFQGEDPDPSGVVVPLEGTAAAQKWQDDMREGFEVDVTRLPPGVKIARFYNSW